MSRTFYGPGRAAAPADQPAETRVANLIERNRELQEQVAAMAAELAYLRETLELDADTVIVPARAEDPRGEASDDVDFVLAAVTDDETSPLS